MGIQFLKAGKCIVGKSLLFDGTYVVPQLFHNKFIYKNLHDDRAIQLTDNDAVEAKASAVKLGYWKDPYIKYFNYEHKTKAPEINRGYFARSQSIEAVLKDFVTFNSFSQIINIGSGSDTLYFRLLDQNILPNKFIEIDFLENVMKKISQFQHRKLFKDKLNITSHDKILQSVIKSPYYLFPFDLRTDPNQFIEILKEKANVDFTSPTLFIAECVLVYVNSKSVDNFLETISKYFLNSVFLSYEPVNMEDVFGKVMISNLKMRHIELNGVSSCTSKESHMNRFKNAGFTEVQIWLISEVYKSFRNDTMRRIESIEMLDDPEMMKQLFDHYCLIMAATRPGLMRLDRITDILSIID